MLPVLALGMFSFFSCGDDDEPEPRVRKEPVEEPFDSLRYEMKVFGERLGISLDDETFSSVSLVEKESNLKVVSSSERVFYFKSEDMDEDWNAIQRYLFEETATKSSLLNVELAGPFQLSPEWRPEYLTIVYSDTLTSWGFVPKDQSYWICEMFEEDGLIAVDFYNEFFYNEENDQYYPAFMTTNH